MSNASTEHGKLNFVSKSIKGNLVNTCPGLDRFYVLIHPIHGNFLEVEFVFCNFYVDLIVFITVSYHISYN